MKHHGCDIIASTGRSTPASTPFRVWFSDKIPAARRIVQTYQPQKPCLKTGNMTSSDFDTMPNIHWHVRCATYVQNLEPAIYRSYYGKFQWATLLSALPKYRKPECLIDCGRCEGSAVCDSAHSDGQHEASYSFPQRHTIYSEFITAGEVAL